MNANTGEVSNEVGNPTFAGVGRKAGSWFLVELLGVTHLKLSPRLKRGVKPGEIL